MHSSATDTQAAINRAFELFSSGQLEAAEAEARGVLAEAANNLGVGFLSPDLGRHPVGWFLLGGFEAFDHQRLRPVCFSDRAHVDMFTDRFRAVADGWFDIGLDTFPFSGGLTSCEALWMGVPVVTWAGERMCGRQTASFLARVGPDELATDSRQHDIEIAVALAGAPQRRAMLRRELRERMSGGSLCDAGRLAGEFTELIEKASARWGVI